MRMSGPALHPAGPRAAWRRALALLSVLAAVAVMAVLTGCAAQSAQLLKLPPADLPQSFELERTPFYPQTEYQCGPAALATVLSAAGIPVELETLSKQVFLPARTGTLQVEMMAGARRQGAIATRLPVRVEALLRELHAGHPVVVFENRGLSWAPVWHYAVLVGYDLRTGEATFRSGVEQRETMALRTFEHIWMRAGAWAFVALPPGQWPQTAEENAVVEASIGFERSATPRQAGVAYRTALERWPGNLSLQLGLGNSLHAVGDKPAAAEVFRAAAIAHASAPAWINLSSTLVDLGRGPEAVEAAREAVAHADEAWRDRAQAQMDEALKAQARQ
jgi:hypothetical protein